MNPRHPFPAMLDEHETQFENPLGIDGAQAVADWASDFTTPDLLALDEKCATENAVTMPYIPTSSAACAVIAGIILVAVLIVLFV